MSFLGGGASCSKQETDQADCQVCCWGTDGSNRVLGGRVAGVATPTSTTNMPRDVHGAFPRQMGKVTGVVPPTDNFLLAWNKEDSDIFFYLIFI